MLLNNILQVLAVVSEKNLTIGKKTKSKTKKVFFLLPKPRNCLELNIIYISVNIYSYFHLFIYIKLIIFL